MEREKVKSLGFKAGMLSMIAVVFVVVLLMNWNVGNSGVIVTETRSWKEFNLPYLGDADPGSGASGILIAGIAVDGVTWTSNLSYGTDTYHTTETNNTHAGDNVPYDTNAYIFVKARFNRSDLVDTDGADSYNLNWVNCWLNCSDLSVSSLEMTEANVSGCDATDFIWVHFYAGPYTWNRGQNVTGIQMKIKLFK